MPVAGGDARTTAGKDAGATAYRITRPQHSMLPEIHTLKLRSAGPGIPRLRIETWGTRSPR